MVHADMLNETFTITGEMLFWTYATFHVLYGLVTHYHSVVQVRKYNRGAPYAHVPSWKMCIWFVARMAWGFPVFFIFRVVAPTGDQWHMSPDDIEEWSV